MTKRIWSVICAIVLTGLASYSQETSPLRLLQTVRLQDVRGRIDHFDVDLAGQRLFMSALGNNTLEVFDLRTNKRIHTIRGLHEPQGVTYSPDSNRIFVANGADGTCRIFDGSTYQLLKIVHFSSDADDTRYDAATKHVLVGYGDQGNAGLAVLDGATGDLLQTIKLPDHPESFQLEKSGSRIFVNVPSAGNIIEVVDRSAGKIVATWTLDGAQDNFPMDLNEADHRLFVACRTPPQVLVLDTDSGKIIAHVPSASHADDIWYDAAHKRAYVSGGEGFITVVGQDDVNHYRKIAQIKTLPGARTSFLVPRLKRLYLGVWGQGSQPEELQVYETQP
jgi:DNA-binding beta-propeller fold protein YncE